LPYPLYIKDKNLQRYFDRLMYENFTSMPPNIAKMMGRNPTIKRIRNLDKTNPYILIGYDDKYRVSMLRMRKPLKITKNGDKYVFSF